MIVKKTNIFPIFIVFITYLSPLFALENNDSNILITQEIVKLFSTLFWGDALKILSYMFLLVIIVLLYRHKARKSSKSLSIFPIVNETGKTGEFEGIAAGIGDILMADLYKIDRLANIESTKSNWTEDTQKNERKKSNALTPKTQKANVAGNAKTPKIGILIGSSLMNVQQLGDISFGKIKISFRVILLLKLYIFGGKNLSGALQKYGKINTIVLRLETRHPVFFFGEKDIPDQYYEVSWPSETIHIDHLCEGVPTVIEELAYRVMLSDPEIGTQEWTAYKWFLKGNSAFNDFNRNETRKDHLNDAIEYYRECVYIDPDFARAHYNLGVALDRMGGNNLHDALFRFEQAIRLNANIFGAEAYVNLATIYWHHFHDDAKTIIELDKAKTFNKELADIYNIMGLIYLESADNNSKKKAAEYFKKAQEKSSKNSKELFFYNECVALFALANYRKAQESGDKAIAILKENVQEIPLDLIQTLAIIHVKKGRTEQPKLIRLLKALTGKDAKEDEYRKALDYFKKGLNKEPNNLDMLFGYGEVLRESGKFQKAIIIQRRFIRLYPEYSSGYTEIAKTLKALKYDEDEIEAYKKVGELLASSTEDNQNDVMSSLKMEQKNPKQTVINMSVLGGFFLYVDQDFDQAVKCFDNIADKLGKSNCLLKAEMLHNYGLALSSYILKIQEQYNEASKELKQVEDVYIEAFENWERVLDSDASGELKQANVVYNKAFENLERVLDSGADGELKQAEVLYNEASNKWQQVLDTEVSEELKQIGIQYLIDSEQLLQIREIYYISFEELKQVYKKAYKKLKQAQGLYEDIQNYDKAKCCTDLASFLEICGSNDTKIAEKIDNSYQQASELYEKAGLFQLASDTHVLNAGYLIELYNNTLVVELLHQARKYCDKAIQLNSSNASAYHIKGVTYYNTSDYTNAIAQYEKTVELNYDQPDIHYNLGLSYYYTKEYEKAEKAFTTSIKLSDVNDPLMVETYEWLFNTFEKQDRWAEAEKRFTKIVNLVPNENSYRIHLGQALEQSNKMDEAAESFNFVLKQVEGSELKLKHIALYHLADIYAEQGANIRKACSMAKEALKIKRELLKQQEEYTKLLKTDKELAEINHTIGWLYYQKNQPKKARFLLEKTLSHSMSNPKWHARLACAYEKEAKIISDASKQSDLLEKARVQWEIVSELPLDKNNLKQVAQEHLKSIVLAEI